MLIEINWIPKFSSSVIEQNCENVEKLKWQFFCEDTEADDLETDYFYFINAIRAREKKGVAVTDVTAFDQLDGVVVNQDSSKLQQGWINVVVVFVDDYDDDVYVVAVVVDDNDDVVPVIVVVVIDDDDDQL